MQRNKVLSIFLKYYLDKNLDSQLSIDKNFLLKVWALVLDVDYPQDFFHFLKILSFFRSFLVILGHFGLKKRGGYTRGGYINVFQKS